MLSAHRCMIIANIGGANVRYGDHKLTTELDSHANILVAGAYSTIISRTGLHAEVVTYSPHLPSRQIENIDVALAYDDP